MVTLAIPHASDCLAPSSLTASFSITDLIRHVWHESESMKSKKAATSKTMRQGPPP